METEKKIELTELEKKLIKKHKDFFEYMWDVAFEHDDDEFSMIGWNIIPPMFIRVLRSVKDIDKVTVDSFICFLRGIDIDGLYNDLAKNCGGENIDCEANLCYSLTRFVVDYFNGKEIEEITVDDLDGTKLGNDNDPRDVLMHTFMFLFPSNRDKNPHNLTIEEVEEYVLSKTR